MSERIPMTRTGYDKIIRAVLDAAAEMRGESI